MSAEQRVRTLAPKARRPLNAPRERAAAGASIIPSAAMEDAHMPIFAERMPAGRDAATT